MRAQFAEDISRIARRLRLTDVTVSATDYATMLAVVIITGMVSLMMLAKKVRASFGRMGRTFAAAASGNGGGNGSAGSGDKGGG